MDHDIPPLRAPHLMPPIRTEHDLEQHWRALMGPLGFGRTRLWVVIIDSDGMVVPHIIVVDENPELPDRQMIENLVAQLQDVTTQLDVETRIAGLWTRPGRGPMRATDVAWLRCLNAALVRSRLDPWPLHFANDAFLRRVTPDDLAA